MSTLAAALLLGSAGLAPAASAAVDPAAKIVINEVYGGGGNNGAPIKHDFIELYNKSADPINLSGWSVQYASANGTSWAATPLTGWLAPGDHFLVTQAAGTGDVPPVVGDVAGTLAMSGTAGKVALVQGTSALTCALACATDPTVVDLVAWGAATGGAGAPAPGTNNATSVQRIGERQNTGVNSADFTAGAPTPTKSTIVVTPPVDPPVDPPADEVTIAAIQGTGDTTPLPGVRTTRGVVTATYPTGGFNGYVIQTAGTGGVLDPATHTASHALFIYSPSTVGSVAIGDFVKVTGTVAEFNGVTQLSVTGAAGLEKLTETPAPVVPSSMPWPTTDAAREVLESMLFQPTDSYTVTNPYNTAQYGEIGLAYGDTPLLQPTDVALPNSPEAAAVAADNEARKVSLDDGSSFNFNSDRSQVPPFLPFDQPISVGATVTFTDPVIVDYRNSTWKFTPTTTVTGATARADWPFEFSPVATPTPDAERIGDADLRVSSFNVQNYFTTFGESYPGCTSYKDRTGAPVNVNTCPGNGPRGAWDQANFERQQAKIVEAINSSGADVAGLEEIENSLKLGKTPDAALSALVDALNADAGVGTWAYVASSAELPDIALQDVITSAIIYKPAAVSPVGAARALGTESADGVNGGAFQNAREPIGQVFAPVGGGESFLLVVNHFKSKGSAGPFPGDAEGTDGQGASNESRKRQATALVTWVESVQADSSVESVLLVGDFNSYGKEDPAQIIVNGGFTDVESHVAAAQDVPVEYSYSYQGLSGSLDHVYANDAALERITGADTWNINAGLAVALNWSRWNNYGAILWEPSTPFAASDHDPVVVGLTSGVTPEPATRTVQVLATNDFHGRIVQNPGSAEAGGAVLSGAVRQLEQQYPDTVFAGVGDQVGATTFESFIQNDKPTIDVLNAAGMEVSAVGNHEFDQGYRDLVDRIAAPYDAVTNPEGGAEWPYLGANVRLADGSPALPESWVKEFGSVQVGFIGVVTDHLDELVSPDGLEGLVIEAPVVAANREASELKAAGVDVVVLLAHEGAAGTALSAATDPTTDLGRIVTGANADIDAIFTAHTHLVYNHEIPVQAWIDENRAVTTRPVVSGGQYGGNLNQVLFEVDTATGDLLGIDSTVLPLTTPAVTGPPAVPATVNYPADPAVATIVADAVAKADVLGAVELGTIGGPFNRAKLANGTTENRGGESTLGNLVAEVQRWATESPTAGAAQIAVMNPGGLRADMVGNPATPGAYPAPLTYKQAAVVQPFANTLVNMKLTGAQLKAVLEQQWQPAGAARPFLKLGLSKGFTYTYDPTGPAGDRIRTMSLNGVAIEAATTYSVTANSFLAAGGDNFGALREGTERRDTGKSDLQAMVDYMAVNKPVPVDYKQQAVGVTFPAGAPAQYGTGDTLAFTLSSLAYSTAADLKDTSVSLSIGGVAVGTAAVDNTVGTAIDDEIGKAAVSVVLPAGLPSGAQTLTITGDTTGTVVTLPITITQSQVATTTTLTTSGSQQVHGWPLPLTLTATVKAADGSKATGQVEFRSGTTVLGTATLNANGRASLALPTGTPAGAYQVTAVYLGTPTHAGSTSAAKSVTVLKAPSATLLLANRSSQQFGSQQVTLTGGVLVPFASSAGSVTVKDNGTEVGTVALSGGVATWKVPADTAVGTHKYTFTFVPAGSSVASSTSNSVTITVTAPPATVPGAPTISATGVGDKSARVTWTAPASTGGAAITGYTVTASPGGATCTTTALTCVVTGLTNGTSYTFTVTATNAAGTSPASAPSAPITLSHPAGTDAATSVSVSAKAQCINGKPSLAVYVLNKESVKIDVRVTTPAGEQKITGLAAGTAKYLTFTAAQLADGSATVAAYKFVGGKGVHTVYDLKYTGITCS